MHGPRILIEASAQATATSGGQQKQQADAPGPLPASCSSGPGLGQGGRSNPTAVALFKRRTWLGTYPKAGLLNHRARFISCFFYCKPRFDLRLIPRSPSDLVVPLMSYEGDSLIEPRIGYSLNQDKHINAPVTGLRETTRLY